MSFRQGIAKRTPKKPTLEVCSVVRNFLRVTSRVKTKTMLSFEHFTVFCFFCFFIETLSNQQLAQLFKQVFINLFNVHFSILRYTNSDLKISVYVCAHVKAIP